MADRARSERRIKCLSIERLRRSTIRQWSDAPIRRFKIFCRIDDYVVARAGKKVQASICADNPQTPRFNARGRPTLIRKLQHRQLSSRHIEFLHQFLAHLRRAFAIGCPAHGQPSCNLPIQGIDAVRPIVNTPRDVIAIDLSASSLFENPRHLRLHQYGLRRAQLLLDMALLTIYSSDRTGRPMAP
jgi:hypothetical protein